MSTVVLYHAQCADGFGAAYAAWKALGDNAVYVPVQHGKPYPPEIEGGVERLVILDFSYPLETLLRLKDCCEQLIIRDHHQTARPALAALIARQCPGVDVLFDNDKSGAVLAWEYFHPGTPVPDLLLYVQDRDLWRWELPYSREVSAALRSYPFDFRTWELLEPQARITQNERVNVYTCLVPQGEAILRSQNQQIRSLAAAADIQPVGGYEVPVVNTPLYQSELGDALAERFPDAPFSASFFLNAEGQRVYSLRSRGDFDVSAVAKQFGGGGHKNAAGFTI